MNSPERLDKILFNRGLFDSRSKAEQAILAEKVEVNSIVTVKPGKKFNLDVSIVINSNEPNYVSRGAKKLIKALDFFQLDVSNLTCIDLGASTGGFTQVLLERNCTKVYCIDVGTGQLHPQILAEKRVVNHEKTHVKELSIELIPDLVDLIVIDVSFISLTKVLKYLLPFMKNQAEIVALIKPQFEVGKNNLSKGGIVKDEKLHTEVIENIKTFANSLNLDCLNYINSPILGGDGNKEFLCHLRKSTGMNV